MRRWRMFSWGAFALLLAGCDSGTGPVDIALEVLPVTLGARGDTARLVARVDGEPAAATWRSLDPTIVTVTEDGLATAVAPGTARVTATSKGLQRTGSVTVLPDAPAVHSVLVTPAAAVLNVGDTVRYTARAYGADGSELFGHPVAWSTPSPAVVHLDETGLATALTAGYGQVDASIGGVQVSVALTVIQPETLVDSVWVGPVDRTVQVGDTVRYLARAFDAAGAELAGFEPEWSTTTPTVLSLDADGLARALSTGQGVIVATIDGVSANTGLTVQAVSTVTRLEIYSVGIMFPGERIGFRATALDTEGVPVDGATVVWSSGNPDVVEAAEDGTMTARAPGWSVVEAAVGPVRERRTVRVSSEPAHGLVVSVIPNVGHPQLRLVSLGAVGGSSLLHQGLGLREPVASPDGSRLAFVMETPDGGRDLFVINADGSGLMRLTTNPGPDDQPAWSPDGGSIAFRSGVDGLLDIWIVQADGSGLRNLTDSGQIRIGSLGAERPVWSPDGEWLAYAWGDRSLQPARLSLRMIRKDGSESRVITSLAGFEDTEPSFSPDGDRIAFRRNGGGLVNRILVADLNGTLYDPGADLGSGRTPRWSPDGEWLAYIRPVTLVDAPGALILKRIGWGEERVLGSAADVHWMPSP